MSLQPSHYLRVGRDQSEVGEGRSAGSGIDQTLYCYTLHPLDYLLVDFLEYEMKRRYKNGLRSGQSIRAPGLCWAETSRLLSTTH